MRGSLGGRSKVFQPVGPPQARPSRRRSIIKYCEAFGTGTGTLGSPRPGETDFGAVGVTDLDWMYDYAGASPWTISGGTAVLPGSTFAAAQNKATVDDRERFKSNDQWAEWDWIQNGTGNRGFEIGLRLYSGVMFGFGAPQYYVVFRLVWVEGASELEFDAYWAGPDPPGDGALSDITVVSTTNPYGYRWRFEIEGDPGVGRVYRDGVLLHTETSWAGSYLGLNPGGPYGWDGFEGVGIQNPISGALTIDNLCFGDL